MLPCVGVCWRAGPGSSLARSLVEYTDISLGCGCLRGVLSVLSLENTCSMHWPVMDAIMVLKTGVMCSME